MCNTFLQNLKDFDRSRSSHALSLPSTTADRLSQADQVGVMSLGSILTFLGFVVLIHCAWGVSSYRDMLKLTQQEFTGLPQQLHLELLASVALCLTGGYLVAGNMKPIVLSKGAPSMDVGSFRSDFVTVNHRGAALPMPTTAS